jgi:hypothetical protein
MEILQSEPDPCTGTCLTSSDDGNQVVGIKVEEVADLILEEDPGPTTSPLIKTEQSVRCVSVLGTLHSYPELPVCQCVFCLHKSM